MTDGLDLSLPGHSSGLCELRMGSGQDEWVDTTCGSTLVAEQVRSPPGAWGTPTSGTTRYLDAELWPAATQTATTGLPLHQS